MRADVCGVRRVVRSNPATLARDGAVALVHRTAPGTDHLSPFLLMSRSAPNPRAAEILRAGIENHVEAHLLDSPHSCATPTEQR
ncbi:hypothetical protein AB0L10_23105 [Streptomyces flaveolus]|uniref:hypothetical protein n=1 Tax=Streptomyces flaveolus TaxID=67297 RepID=UPI0034416A1F